MNQLVGRLFGLDASRDGRVFSMNPDGSDSRTLVTGCRIPDGIVVDHIYWTQKGPDNGGQGRLFRTNLEIPAGQNATNRRDITVLFDGLPEPIDLELDLKNRHLYWTDRGNPPLGNSVSRTSIDGKPTQDIVLSDLMEGIGIALDIAGDRMFVTDLAGSVYSAKLNGSQKRVLAYRQGNLTGVAYAEVTSGALGP